VPSRSSPGTRIRESLDFTRLSDNAQLIPSFVGWPPGVPGPSETASGSGSGKKSIVQGVEEIRAWEPGDPAAVLAEDPRWAAEMDWEAHAIVEGLGRMLGVEV
jgi:hypothetical protein